MAKGLPPEFKRDVVTVAPRSDAAFEELASDFGISVNSLRRRMNSESRSTRYAGG